MLTHFSLFSGIGGIDLAAEWAGFKTVGQCEFAEYPRSVLLKHWPYVPRWRDIRNVNAKDAYTFTGIRPGSVSLISGGFPCQPFSVAGKQKGTGDARYLWPEMLRVIAEFGPRWVLGENVPGILSIAADDICKDLERQGYEITIFDFEAAAVGAKHRRERIFFVGHAKHDGPLTTEIARVIAKNAEWREEGKEWTFEFAGTGRLGNHTDVADTEGRKDFQRERGNMEKTPAGQKNFDPAIGAGGQNVADPSISRDGRLLLQSGRSQQTDANPFRDGQNVADTNGAGCKKQHFTAVTSEPGYPAGGDDTDEKVIYNPDGRGCDRDHRRDYEIESEIRRWWAVEPELGRVANGIPRRVDRLKCLGNAVVPQQVYPILRAIASIEKSKELIHAYK